MLPNHSKSTLFTALFFASIVSVSCAASGDRGGPKGPPPEAIKACTDLSQGDVCSFTGRRDDEVSGTCIVLPGGDEGLACAPEGGPPDEGRRPE